ncbi:modification methylase DpnIIB [Peptococcaceae bacterium CEB3]|nr:modification methylase DpnIIB [Peptococcaceae bacterium CEB3]
MSNAEITFEFNERPTIKGFPELRWTGKRPYRSTQYFPAQLRERYGEEQNGWINKIFWGDNLQVMSHLLKEFRGKVDLIYIDPPFDSKADYKKKIAMRGVTATSDSTVFEEKQYGDIWTNDEYLQFMYERLIILRELLSDSGSIYMHCDWHNSHYLRSIMDEVFGPENFKAEIAWKKATKTTNSKNFGSEHDTIFCYVKCKSQETFNQIFSSLKENELRTKYIYLETPSGEIVKLTREEKLGLTPLRPGRRFRGVPLINMNQNRPNLRYEFLGHTRVWAKRQSELEKMYIEGMIFQLGNELPQKKGYLDENPGAKVNDIWVDLNPVNSQAIEKTDYPTQKPESLLERIMLISSNPGDLVFDCFMGSGTTQAVAMKLGRRFIGADINLGAIQTATKRLISLADELKPKEQSFITASAGGSSETEPEHTKKSIEDVKYTGFEVYNVNNYEFFRNPIEAHDLLMEALEIQPFPQSDIWDGELDGRMVKIMPVNRIATKADLEELKANLPYKTYEKRKEENPSEPVERITVVCMGHEPDLKASLEAELSEYKLDIEIVDILRDKADLQLKREAEAEIVCGGGKLVVRAFYPLNLMQKLSLHKEYVEDWRQLVESIMIDWNYDGVVMQPTVTDVPGKKNMVSGVYDIPSDAGSIKVKITDLLSESLEVEVR